MVATQRSCGKVVSTADGGRGVNMGSKAGPQENGRQAREVGASAPHYLCVLWT